MFRHYADLAAADAGRVVETGVPDVSSRVVHEPVGVCALITPWNYPLLQTSYERHLEFLRLRSTEGPPG